MEKIYYVPTDKKTVCLTFDDGTNDPATTIILNILKKHQVKATFFVLTENILKTPNILKHVVAEGHEVGIHGYTHKSFRKHPKLTVYRHIKKSVDILQSEFGVTPKYFRPPYGTLTSDADQICGEFNLTPVGFTVMEKDWQPWNAPKKSDCIVRKCSPGKIIVMHDGYRNYKHTGTTIENLSQILPILLSQGYSFSSVQELKDAKSTKPLKTFNGIPLLHHEMVNYDIYGHTTLFLYWDINAIQWEKSCNCPTCGNKMEHPVFELQLTSPDGHMTHLAKTYPSPTAMEEWHKGIEFPLNSIGKTTSIAIKNNGVFEKIQ